jgi:anaphase-promoting complex subunit 1
LLVYEAVSAASGEISASSGVELNLDDFTRIRFGQDKRLDEVARMLQSSEVPTVRMIERPELRCAHKRNAFWATKLIRDFFQ